MKSKMFFYMWACLLAVLSLSFATPVFADQASYTVSLDRTYLGVAAVSDVEIVLTAAVADAGGQSVKDKELIYSITQGEEYAEIDGDLLTIKSEGSFTVRAALKDHPDIFDEAPITASNLTFTNVRFANDFSAIICYTQPFDLKMLFDSSIYNLAYLQFEYSVVEGPARIFTGDYLQIMDAGRVVLKATSVFDPDTSVTVEFDVTDPDADALESGCSSSAFPGGMAAVLAVLALGAVILHKKCGKR